MVSSRGSLKTIWPVTCNQPVYLHPNRQNKVMSHQEAVRIESLEQTRSECRVPPSIKACLTPRRVHGRFLAPRMTSLRNVLPNSRRHHLPINLNWQQLLLVREAQLWDLQRQPHFIRRMRLRGLTALHRQDDPWDLVEWGLRPMYRQYHRKFLSTHRSHVLLIRPTVLFLPYHQSPHLIPQGPRQRAHAQAIRDIRNLPIPLGSARIGEASMTIHTDP